MQEKQQMNSALPFPDRVGGYTSASVRASSKTGDGMKIQINFNPPEPPTQAQLDFAYGISAILGIEPPNPTIREVGDFIDTYQQDAAVAAGEETFEPLLCKFLANYF